MSHEPAEVPDFSKAGGLLPVVAQDAATGEVLMLAYMNAESFAETLATSVLAQSPACAMALPVLGQIEAKRGALERAAMHYEEALRLCEPGTEAEIRKPA